MSLLSRLARGTGLDQFYRWMCIEASQSESVAVRALNFVDDQTNESRCSEVVECSFVYFYMNDSMFSIFYMNMIC